MLQSSAGITCSSLYGRREDIAGKTLTGASQLLLDSALGFAALGTIFIHHEGLTVEFEY